MIKDKEKYLEHINDSEQIIVMSNLLDKIFKVIREHVIEYTDFLDPYQRRLSRSILNRFSEIEYKEEGGYEGAERKSIIIYPHYLNNIDSPIRAIEIGGKFRFTEVNHRDYLGAILALGVRRGKIGDITVHDNFAQVIILRELLNYLIYNLKSIGREKVKIQEIPLSRVSKGAEEFKEIYTTVASLRLDIIVSLAINGPRSESNKIINNGKVKVNWQPILRASYEVDEGDLFSIKGYGRFKLHKILGQSKKGRTKIIIRKYI